MNKKYIIPFIFVIIFFILLTTAVIIGFVSIPTAVFFQRASERQDGYTTIYTAPNTDLKIMQFTDPQTKHPINNYDVYGGSNEKTFIFLKRMVEATDPDLVIITGDLVMALPINNYPFIIKYAELFEKLNQYWCFTFGNHDSEGTYVYTESEAKSPMGQMTKQKIIKAMQAYPHCLIEQGDAEEGGGYGNYFINVREQKTEKLIYTLCMADCVFEVGADNCHDEKTPSQINWYNKHINAISDMKYGKERTNNDIIKSMVFTHVAVPQIYQGYQEALNTENYFYGDLLEGSASEADCEKCKFFDNCVEIGSTTAMFFGHHHNNGFDIKYKNIHLVFGQHSGLSHYYRISSENNSKGGKDYDFRAILKYGDERGGTMITINTGTGDFVIEQKLARTLIKYDDIGIDYNKLADSLAENPQNTVIK